MGQGEQCGEEYSKLTSTEWPKAISKEERTAVAWSGSIFASGFYLSGSARPSSVIFKQVDLFLFVFTS